MDRDYRNGSTNDRHLASQQEPMLAAILFLIMGVAGAACYVANHRYHIRSEQLLEGSLYLVCLIAALWMTVHCCTTYKRKWDKSWPRRPIFVPPHKDRAYVEKAFEQNAIVLGYEHRNPCLWSDDARRMQSILLGASGAGKTTVLHNIVAQDIDRMAGPAQSPCPLPIILIDGKGDASLLRRIHFAAAAAGRLHQFRVLDPSNPQVSARYNPLALRPGDSYQERAALTFESFNLEDDFFRDHQANYFNNLVHVLAHTGQQMNMYDVLVMALDEQVLKDQINEASSRIERLSAVTAQMKLNFSMSAKNLLQSLQDRERVPKIQGLINKLMIFIADELSQITCAYDNLLNFDDVIDQQLILFVSLNINRNPRAVTALGRMLLQDLQLMVGKRYGSGRNFVDDGSPMVSVILDEFAPFAYSNFAQILQTARGSNIAFLFSLQSIAQLDRVSKSFRHDVTSAANTIMLMKVFDEESARYFQQAASQVSSERLSERVQRRNLLSEKYDRVGVGNSTPVKEPLVPDEHIKRHPRGQIHLLMSDGKTGAPGYAHLHARRPPLDRAPEFEPILYPAIAPARSNAQGANLRFKDATLLRRYGRIAGRKNQESAA